MKNKLFAKTTALMMGSLIIFSGSALAMRSHDQKVTNAEALDEVELLIAQQEPIVPEEQKDIVLDIITVAKTDIGKAKAEAIGVLETEEAKSIVANFLTAAESIIGNAEAITDVTILSKGEAEVAVSLLNQAKSKLGDASGQLNALVEIDPGATAAIKAVNVAETSVGDAVTKSKVAIKEAE